MPFLDTNSQLTTKPYNSDIKCQSNYESYDIFFGTKIRGVQSFLLTVGGFSKEREYSGADWLVPLLVVMPSEKRKIMKKFKNNIFFINVIKLNGSQRAGDNWSLGRDVSLDQRRFT